MKHTTADTSETRGDATTTDPTAQAESIMVGIPAYNEEGSIGAVVDEARKYADEVLVVDDGSTDRTVASARGAGATVVEHEQNRGYGGALRTIFDEAHGRGMDRLVILDADGQHDPRDIRRLADAQRDSGAEIVVGSRFADGAETDAPIYRRFGLAVINGLTNAGLHLGYGIPKITDTQSGFRMYDSDAIETMSGNADLSDGMDVSIDVLFVAAEAGHRIIEVPINITYDVEESSTHHPLVQGGTLLLNILSRLYSDRPARLLNIPAAIFVFLGVALTVLTLTGSSLVAAVPLLAIALLLLCGGILSTTAIFLNRV